MANPCDQLPIDDNFYANYGSIECDFTSHEVVCTLRFVSGNDYSLVTVHDLFSCANNLVISDNQTSTRLPRVLDKLKSSLEY